VNYLEFAESNLLSGIFLMGHVYLVFAAAFRSLQRVLIGGDICWSCTTSTRGTILPSTAMSWVSEDGKRSQGWGELNV